MELDKSFHKTESHLPSMLIVQKDKGTLQISCVKTLTTECMVHRLKAHTHMQKHAYRETFITIGTCEHAKKSERSCQMNFDSVACFTYKKM